MKGNTRTPAAKRNEIMIHNTVTGRSCNAMARKREEKDWRYKTRRDRQRLRTGDGAFASRIHVIGPSSLTNDFVFSVTGRGRERLANSLGRLLPPSHHIHGLTGSLPSCSDVPNACDVNICGTRCRMHCSACKSLVQS